jgi:hypothetical protein
LLSLPQAGQAPGPYPFASGRPQRKPHTCPPGRSSSDVVVIPTSGLLCCALSASTKPAPTVRRHRPDLGPPMQQAVVILLSDVGGPHGDGPRASEPLRTPDPAPTAAELLRMASSAVPEARRRGRFNSASTANLPAADEDDQLCLRLHLSPQQRLPATASGHLLRPPSSRARETVVPLLRAPCNRRARMDTTGERGWQKVGRSHGSCGESIFAAPHGPKCSRVRVSEELLRAEQFFEVVCRAAGFVRGAEPLEALPNAP